jgi:hypothetical protein
MIADRLDPALRPFASIDYALRLMWAGVAT